MVEDQSKKKRKVSIAISTILVQTMADQKCPQITVRNKIYLSCFSGCTHSARTNVGIGHIGFSIGNSITFLYIGYIYWYQQNISYSTWSACWGNIFCLPNIGLKKILILVAIIWMQIQISINVNLNTIFVGFRSKLHLFTDLCKY